MMRNARCQYSGKFPPKTPFTPQYGAFFMFFDLSTNIVKPNGLKFNILWSVPLKDTYTDKNRQKSNSLTL